MAQQDSDCLPPKKKVITEIDYSSAESPTHAVVKAISDLEGASVKEPLYDRIQTGAMHDLLHYAQLSDRYVGVEFTVGEYTISLNSNKRLLIYEGEPVTNNH